ncbi:MULTISPECIES: hypothetical protein [Serratia]|uniref:hypothetical protein n=1 Tax=Serratia TaxID=613 RepID=UPI001604314C|nr:MULTISPECIES: hypothetical protein [Serratia]MBB1585121.1 hypothetical protein [Serratia sp. OS31]MBV6695274.1 hypothetical protein [Serratia quinivorans]
MKSKVIYTKSIHYYRAGVKRIFENRYGLTMEDISLSDDFIFQAFEAKESPEQLVEWYGEKYDLTRIR